MFSSLNKVGQFFRSVSGWIWGIGVGIPSVGTFVTGLVEGQPWSYIIYMTTGVAALAMAFIYHGIKSWDYAAAKIGTKAEKTRILKELDEYENSGYPIIDIPTAAAIWAGTREEGSINRHLCFRKLKAGASNKLIQTVNPPGGTVVNIHTLVPIDSLRNYFETVVFK